MCRIMKWVLFTLAVGAYAVIAPVAQAASVRSGSVATDLVGGTVTVTRLGGIFASATFVDMGDGSVAAISPGSAGFSLTVSAGDTFDSIWTLTNTDLSFFIFNRITAVAIDLLGTGASALFDDDSSPSTPFSDIGRKGVLYFGGNGISSALEVNPWSDPDNAGDMYTATSIVFSSSLGRGEFSSWMDDTDIVAAPEPAEGTLVLAGLALATLALRRVKTTRI